MKIVRARATVVVIHEERLLGFHARDPFSGEEYFFLPGGRIEDGEEARATAVRETLEETGYRIRLDPAREFFARYDFEWNGAVNECHTWFYRGYLEPAAQSPPPVKDASYHLGVAWVPIAAGEATLSYHPAILEAFERLKG